MDINLNSNRVVVCAPRWKYQKSQETDFRMIGACYSSHLNTENFSRKVPLFDIEKDLIKRSYNYGQGESGFAIHMPLDRNELIIGAPGVFNWKGTSIKCTDRSLDTTELFADEKVVNLEANSDLLNNDYFGYALTSGYFFSNATLLYATGAPRSEHCLGKVLIYQLHQTQLRKIDAKIGSQIGEYFGAALSAGDINDDGFDDLFVGAPSYKASEYNEGRLYLFLGGKEGTLREPLEGKFVNGLQSNGQFGTTITYLGNMNRDKSEKYCRYVAVSAPYEEVSGVVYIFKGDTLGLDINPVQRIVGSSVVYNMRGFGISISKPADIDKNGYDDIAIGAHESGHMVLLRSKPLVKVITYFEYTPSHIANDTKEFGIVVCHEFYSFQGNDTVDIIRTIVVDENLNRAFVANPMKDKKVTLYQRRPTCENITINLREKFNSYSPLILKLTHKLIERHRIPGRIEVGENIVGSDNFCLRCGVYDKFRSTSIVKKSVPFFLGCGKDNVCVSELEFEPQFTGKAVSDNTFIIGASNVIELKTRVVNKGEKAYLLRVQVDLPILLSFKKRPTQCDQNRTAIICPLADPLEKNEQRYLNLTLDMGKINKRLVEDFLVINVTILTDSKNNKETFKQLKLHLITEADISISGKSGEQSYPFGNGTKDVEFQQIFQVRKYGQSPVASIRFRIFIPYAIRTDSGENKMISLYQPEAQLEGGPTLTFDSGITYLEEHKFSPTENVDIENTEEVRNKRAIDSTMEEEMSVLIHSTELQPKRSESVFLADNTFEINCNMTKIICVNVTGRAGPFEGSTKSTVFQLRMLFDVKALSGLLKDKTVIRYSTYGLVSIEDPPNLVQSGTRPDMVIVSSIFASDVKLNKINMWIILVSVILGLLVLLILTLSLTKAGFFKRTKKEELEQLKAQQVGIENEGGTVDTIDTLNDADFEM